MEWAIGPGAFDWRWVLAITILLSVLCLIVVIRSKTEWPAKIAWGIILLFPIVGPLMFAALFRPPPRLDESERLPRAPGA